MNEEEMRLKAEVSSLRSELSALRDLLDGGDLPSGVNKLAWKIERQRRALDVLNRRVLSQRFYLRIVDELGRGLTKEEYVEARDRVENEQVKQRLLEEVAV